MKDNFVTIEIAKDLKELGFDKICFGLFKDGKFYRDYETFQWIDFINCIKAPVWQQAIDFLMESLVEFDEYFEIELRYFSDYSGGIYNQEVEILDFDDKEMLVESLLQLLKEKLRK